MKQIWIDMTDLAHWSGHMTGIQRVVYNVAKHYNENGARFFIFDKLYGYRQIVFEDIFPKNTSDIRHGFRKKISNRLVKTLPYRAGRKILRKSVSVGVKYSHLAYHRSPVKIQAAARKAKKIIIRNRPDNFIINNLHHPFSKGDKIVFLGATWYRPGVVMNIGVIKESLDLEVTHLVYDMIPELFPQYFGQGFGDVYIKHMFNALAISDKVLAISQNTRKDVMAFQNKMLLPQIPVDVIRLGDEPTLESAKKSPDSRIKPGDYIVSVGTIEVRKNYLALYYAWKLAANKGISLPKLVVVGRPGWLSTDSMYLMQFDPAVSSNIIVLTDTTDAQLAWLYRNCMLTIYPSWYEGWGLPIAESLNYGKLCLVSDSSSMPEIAGDLVDYFSPFAPDQILDHIVRYKDNPELLKKKEEEIKKNYHAATWQDTYEGVRRAIEQ